MSRNNPIGKRHPVHRYIIIILVVLVVCISFFFYYSYIKQEKTTLKTHLNKYKKIIKSEQQWLANIQLSNGALPLRGKDDGIARIVPYFSSITAIALLQEPDIKHVNAVTEYFDWYYSHLNDVQSDINGIAGTIFDYSAEISDGAVKLEKTEKKYDSIDSYAAVFLMAQWEFYKQTDKGEYLIAHYPEILYIIEAMNATIDQDGLSYAKPDYKIKYLMDNTEVYQGLSCAINLFDQVFLNQYQKGTNEYSEAEKMLKRLQQNKDQIERGIQTILWNEDLQRYEIGLDTFGTILKFDGWTEFYPDSVAQLFPILFRIIEPESKRARDLYQTFCQYYNWADLEHYENGEENFYWGLVAYCGALMGDEEKVTRYLNYYIKNVMPDHNYPAYNADVAWVVLACSKMVTYYEQQIKFIDPLGIVSLK
ncbi:MAG: hypothetical protein ACOX8Q_07440 [Christensenellales bacterium]|jgi:hypothetical protein